MKSTISPVDFDMYRLYDTCGKPLIWRFSSWSDAHHFRCAMGRPDWTIEIV
jgi:hypothetical protein